MASSDAIARYLAGVQVPVQQCGLYITPPTIKQVCQYGEDDFLTGVKIMSADRTFVNKIKDANPDLKDMEKFQLLLLVMNSDDALRERLTSFVEFICPDYQIEVAKGSLNFRQGEDNAIKGQINPFNFDGFAETLHDMFWPTAGTSDAFNPVNEKAEEIARKLEKGREIANKEKGGKSDQNGSIFGLYASNLSIGLCIDINAIYRYTPFQLYDAFNRFNKKSSYDFYMKIKTTPMMSTENMDEPEHWMVNLYGE